MLLGLSLVRLRAFSRHQHNSEPRYQDFNGHQTDVYFNHSECGEIPSQGLWDCFFGHSSEERPKLRKVAPSTKELLCLWIHTCSKGI